MPIFEEDCPKDNLFQHGDKLLYFHISVQVGLLGSQGSIGMCVCTQGLQIIIIIVIIIIITIIYSFTAIGLLSGGSGYFTCKQNLKLVTTRFKSGGLHEKHVVATWNFGNHLSICF